MLPERFKTALKNLFPKQFIRYSLWRSGYAEAELSYLSRVVPRDRISVDVGANVGVYTRALSKLTPVVHAFEPSKELARLLRRTVPSNVVVHEIALSCRGGTASLKTPVVDGKRIFGLASLEQLTSHPRLDTEIVQTSKLDDAVDGDVGFIKIDVEGHELSVLRGARSIISRNRPVLLVECEERHNPGGPAKLFEFMNELNYSGRFISKGKICDVTDFSVGTSQDSKAPYIYNFFFLPDKRSLSFLEQE
jgi:FkbM family methyltransferase